MEQPITNYVARDTLADVAAADPAFYNCLIKSSNGTQDAVCDEIVGSIFGGGGGACNTVRFRDQPYCACVNSIPNAECYFKPCLAPGTGISYMTTRQRDTLKNAKTQCPTYIDCSQIIQAGGRNNIVSNVTQEQNCGGTDINISAGVLLIILVILLVLLLPKGLSLSKGLSLQKGLSRSTSPTNKSSIGGPPA